MGQFTANGIVYEEMPDGNVRVVGYADAPAPQGRVFTLPQSPEKARAEAREEERLRLSQASADRAANAAEKQAAAAERTAGNQDYNNTIKLRSDFDALPPVKEYRTAVAQLATGLKTRPDATGDNALIYAYAKAMDPGSVVRESEMGMAASGASVIDSAVAGLKKQFGIEGGGQLPPEIRDRMRREMLNKVGELNRVYSAQRQRFIEDAKSFGIDPQRVVGNHDGDAFAPIVNDFVKEFNTRQQRADNEVPDPTTGADLKPPPLDGSPPEMPPENGANLARTPDQRLNGVVNHFITLGKWNLANDALRRAGRPVITPGEKAAILKWQQKYPGQPYTGTDIGTQVPEDPTRQSYVGQALSGMNEGIADVVGGPVDLTTAVLNLGTQGTNFLAGTEIPRIENPILGSDWIKEKMAGPFIFEPSNDPTKQFVRRVSESAGSAAVPGLSTGSLARAGGSVLAGAAGGVGGATAQQMFPDNPLVEMGAEILTGGAGAGAIGAAARRNAAKQIENAVPTIPQLKEQAGELYRAAESRGVVASPEQTQQLAANFRQALADEGRISPTGRISEVYPKAKEAVQLIDDYSGNTMNPTQIQNVRGVVGDALASPDKSERRLGSILTDVLDEWANPLAPELRQARDVSSRYLAAEQLERARELAGARASQFTGSGFENALRTEYRGLDRASIKGNTRFNDDVTDAVEKVARGTPASNFFRNLGRLYPSGPVSFGLGSGLPALAAGASTGSPLVGGAVGATMAGLGAVGRGAATHMGIKAADQAELVARNGGKLPEAVVSPEWLETLRRFGLAETAKYLPE